MDHFDPFDSPFYNMNNLFGSEHLYLGKKPNLVHKTSSAKEFTIPCQLLHCFISVSVKNLHLACHSRFACFQLLNHSVPVCKAQESYTT